VQGVDLNLLQFLVVLLQAEATAPLNGDLAEVLKPTSHSLQEKVFYVNVQQASNTWHETRND
jgi:hypothetical protein